MKNIKNSCFNKLLYKLQFLYIRFVKIFSDRRYRFKYKKLLKRYGMNIPIDGSYIDPSVDFDNYDYSLITIGKECVISKGVLFLTHDYSIKKAMRSINKKGELFIKPISIGDNCFIGAKSIILPGTVIGKNVIVGAGTVVKGNVKDNSVIVGNPAKVICSVDEFAKKHIVLRDYIE